MHTRKYPFTYIHTHFIFLEDGVAANRTSSLATKTSKCYIICLPQYRWCAKFKGPAICKAIQLSANRHRCDMFKLE